VERGAVIGTTVSRYRILSKLGGGGMGVVYEAEDSELGRRVAIKFLPDGTASSGDALERFKREARAASALNHPHICTIHDVGVHEGQPFLVMERLEGDTLRHRIGGRGMPVDDVVKLGEQIADALDAAHRAGIVHRDLKPANLFVTSRGDAKILDFGLAKFGTAASGSAVDAAAPTVEGEFFTEAGTTLGTVAYMSPEQARGQAVDARSDLFSLGVVLYEMATGRLPFRGGSTADFFAAILGHDPTPPRELNPDIPPKLEDAILKALDKDPSLRYQTAADLRGDLRRLLRESSGGTRPTAATSSDRDEKIPLKGKDSSGSRRGLWIGVGAVAVVVLGVVGWFATRGGSPGGAKTAAGADAESAAPASANVAAAPEKSIAVLPFADMSQAKDQEYFADGLAEELMGMLSKVPGLKVPARTSSFYFKGRQATMAEIAKTLGVAHVLEGSVRKSGDQLRVSAQLVRAADGFQLWSDTYDRKLDDVFKVQDEIAAAVVRALELKLLEADMPKSTPTHSQEAYSLFLQARALHYRGTHADNLTGISYLERALKLDPNFAPAWFGLGDALIYDYASLGGGTFDDVRRRAGEAAETALRLDPNLSDAHLLMARVYGDLDWNFPAAERESRRTLELDPNNWLGIVQAGYYAMIVGRLDEALRITERVIAVDPASWGSYWAMGDVKWRMGRVAEAEAAYLKATELSPTSALIHTWLAITRLRQGRAAEALEAVERETDEGWKLYGLALTNDALGRRAEADRALAELEATGAESHAWSIASIHACRGEIDEAFSWLDRAYRQRDGMLPMLKSDPCVSHLEGDPRYPALLKKVGLPV